jgi:hypothetical protein
MGGKVASKVFTGIIVFGLVTGVLVKSVTPLLVLIGLAIALSMVIKR